MFLDPQDSLRLGRYGVYEPFETQLFERCLAPGDTVIDVGANIGYYTLAAARAVGPEGKVFAFEPDPSNFRCLHRNVARNGYRNVVLENCAVCDLDGTVELHLAVRNTGDHRIFETQEPRRRIAVPAVRLDSYFGADLPAVRLLKMDIQGAEGRAIAGMHALLAASEHAALFLEFWPAGLRLGGTDPAGFLDRLRDGGFHLRRIDEAAERVEQITISRLLSDHDVSDPTAVDVTRPEYYTNLICFKPGAAEFLDEPIT